MQWWVMSKMVAVKGVNEDWDEGRMAGKHQVKASKHLLTCCMAAMRAARLPRSCRGFVSSTNGSQLEVDGGSFA
jgi:hypothetical protein